ncbi:TfpX/TfpZ family type IV pilin accessory protein [Polaromonas sp.]|uniref:TfpX/TfpZ family type IV pilin accessory protein n=1 Tax=Polaromonas sp. TaxID=1869339 RepID=UPI003BB659E5
MKLKERSTAAALHLLASLAVASLAAVLVFFVWYPYPYREVSGGRELFLLIMAVDLVVGPLLTFVVFNRSKPRRELWRDLSIIGLLQLVTLCYGLWTVFAARPVYLVHEVERFRVVTAADIDPVELPKALPKFQKIPLFGISVIGVRKARDSNERMRALDSALAGRDVSMMPDRWQDLDADNKAQIRQRARTVDFLRARASDGGAAIDQIIHDAGLKNTEVIALPIFSRRTDWSALMDVKDLSIIGYVPVDSF